MASEPSTNNSITSTHTLPNNSDEEVKVMVPPLNFAMVAPGVYRSGHPNRKNFPFLKKLKLKSIMYLSSDEFHEELSQFVKDQNIQVFHYKIDGNKEPFIEIEQKEISNALVKVLDIRNHPVLIHCNKGKHRIGCLVGCLRKLQKWSLTSIFHEYRRFAVTKVLADQEFIEIFSENVPYNPDFKPDWL
ncbi:protein-tyrosine phosphatase [Gigaspora rosea]|uniref:Protein-tyrosine phosphatase n=1 Tax=Gigaspora rosea TaxID=44941 RepID=A0A397UGX6_9GLOM|nr:protein-tyrosine phosphatase [Gigaspora rosea]